MNVTVIVIVLKCSSFDHLTKRFDKLIKSFSKKIYDGNQSDFNAIKVSFFRVYDDDEDEEAFISEDLVNTIAETSWFSFERWNIFVFFFFF